MNNLSDRLSKLNEARAKSKARIAQKSGRRQSVAFDLAKLVRDTCKVIRLEMRLEKKGAV